MRKAAIITLCLMLAATCCACQQVGNPTPLVSTDDSAWYNPYDQSSAVEVTAADGIEYSESISAKLKKCSTAMDAASITDLANTEKELNKYIGATSADSQYINALRRLLHCLNGFYTFNSTEGMLDASIAEVKATYAALSAQMQSSYYLPTEEDIRATAANIAAMADALQQ